MAEPTERERWKEKAGKAYFSQFGNGGTLGLVTEYWKPPKVMRHHALFTDKGTFLLEVRDSGALYVGGRYVAPMAFKKTWKYFHDVVDEDVWLSVSRCYRVVLQQILDEKELNKQLRAARPGRGERMITN